MRHYVPAIVEIVGYLLLTISAALIDARLALAVAGLIALREAREAQP